MEGTAPGKTPFTHEHAAGLLDEALNAGMNRTIPWSVNVVYDGDVPSKIQLQVDFREVVEFPWSLKGQVFLRALCLRANERVPSCR